LPSIDPRIGLTQDVLMEMARQDSLWGPPVTQDQTPEKRLAILAEEFGEYARAVLEKDPDNARDELIQIAAVALANAERLDAGLDRAEKSVTETSPQNLDAPSSQSIRIVSTHMRRARTVRPEQLRSTTNSSNPEGGTGTPGTRRRYV